MAVGYVLVSRSRTLTGRVWYGVIFIFFLIFLTVIINSVRLAVALLMLNLGGRTDGRSNAYAQAMVLLCLAELNVGLIAITLPSFRVLWRRIQAKRATAEGMKQSKDVLEAVLEDAGGILAEEDERAMALARISSDDKGNSGAIEMERM